MGLVIDAMDETGQLSKEHLIIVKRLLTYAAQIEQMDQDAEVSLTFVSNQKIQAMNKEYRGKDQVTDVISFALEESGEGEISIQGAHLPRVLGDIVISLDRVGEQANEYGHSFERELGFLAVHGFLHLLGYDHMNEEDEKRMFARQNEILAGFGLER
ncbi:rRNA maturation RNase YbeY [Lederbergia sp. NSJ-179]|uniref:rRNA maturation RNase YbeY n=1 Tax=Lederbergia sp. NSJ-179 TaxID=2931402 RepID=UPI001FCFCA3D|nr:rRNA maturation RNase YbeY [Lederbergia sp. NSJ-179]MCJ7841845.1 rRNA maturation RNase YbeY [Lederbergia sp. NSJ-179]